MVGSIACKGKVEMRGGGRLETGMKLAGMKLAGVKLAGVKLAGRKLAGRKSP